MMQDIAASLFMEFEKSVLKAESGGSILKTPLNSQASLSSEEVHFILGLLKLIIHHSYFHARFVEIIVASI